MRTSHIVAFQLFGEEMDYRDNIISDIAEAECKHVCRKVIRALQRTTEGMQTGDDTPLKNIWEEVCVQIQFYQSVFWGLYLHTIGTIIWAEVECFILNDYVLSEALNWSNKRIEKYIESLIGRQANLSAT